MTTIDLNYSVIERAVQEFYTAEIALAAQGLAPVDSGDYIAGITVSATQVRATAGHSLIVEKGAAPHVITGRPVLAFQANGMTVFARQVNHPGSPGRNVFMRAIEQTVPA